MARYKEVIFVGNSTLEPKLNTTQAVGLLPDLEILEDADLTEIGERQVKNLLS